MSSRETRPLAQGQAEKIVITTKEIQEKAIAGRCGVREKTDSRLPILIAQEVTGRVTNRIKEETIIENLENVNLETLLLKEDQELLILEIPPQKEDQDLEVLETLLLREVQELEVIEILLKEDQEPEVLEILRPIENKNPDLTETLLQKGSLVHLNQIIKPTGVAKV